MVKHFVIHKELNFCVSRITFKNGYSLSMNIGAGGYNDNHNLRMSPETETIESEKVECAVFAPNGDWVTQRFFPRAEDGNFSVVGYATIEDVENAIKEIMIA